MINMPSSASLLNAADVVVIKIGSALIRHSGQEGVRDAWFGALAEDIEALKSAGKEIIIVSSGGIALGRSALGISSDTSPGDIPLALKQAASAVGQYHMYHAYHSSLSAHGIATAQVLLTLSETEDRRMYLNARETLKTLMDNGILPVINENDTISTEEIRFGDNDRLAVRVGQMMNADAVVLLSTVDGLYSENPDVNPDAHHIPIVDEITDEHIAMAGEALPGVSTGGMKSKLQAAIAAVESGISLVLADGLAEHALSGLLDERLHSTLFVPKEDRRTARKSWIGSHLKPLGSVVIDAGAVKALGDGSSLLPVGVLSVDGTFQRGDVIEVLDEAGKRLAMGVSSYNAKHAALLAGKRTADAEGMLSFVGRDELIHRNDLVLAG